MPAYSVGRASRGKAAKSDVPGPGAYTASSAERMVIPKWSIGTGQRNKLYETGNTPGPGSYGFGSTFTGPKYHFGGRYNQNMRTFSPGPGQYTPNVNSQKKLVTYKFTMPGKGADRGTRTDAPGPGSYNSNGPKKYTGGKFGRDPRGTPILPGGLSVPGPGAYESFRNKSSKNSQSPKYT